MAGFWCIHMQALPRGQTPRLAKSKHTEGSSAMLLSSSSCVLASAFSCARNSQMDAPGGGTLCSAFGSSPTDFCCTGFCCINFFGGGTTLGVALEATTFGAVADCGFCRCCGGHWICSACARPTLAVLGNCLLFGVRCSSSCKACSTCADALRARISAFTASASIFFKSLWTFAYSASCSVVSASFLRCS